MKTIVTCSWSAVALAVLFVERAVAACSGKRIAAASIRFSAFAVNMSTVQRPGNTATVDIRIKRWSTAAERENLLKTAVERTSGLLRALQKMPDHGKISIPVVGPDPHNARLGWVLHYAVASKGEDGGLRVGIATDRYIGFWEARERPRTIDYPFSLIEMRFDNSGGGVGKFAVATKIDFDKKKNQMVLENYASEPVRLNEIKIEK